MAVDKVLNQLTSKALDKAINESTKITQQPQGQSFKDIMSNFDSGADFAKSLGAVQDNGVNPTAQMQVLSAEGIESAVPATEKVTTPETSEKVVNMLSDVNKGSMQMDNLINNILYSGKKFSNQELLVMQAHVYHHAQMMELTVKVAGESVSSVKSVLNTQVQ